MKQIQKHKKTFLYVGLGILAIAFAFKFTVAPAYYFWLLLSTAIIFKIFFLTAVFSEKGFRPSLWLCLILTGVALILASMLFKTVFPIPALYKVLFYGAISLKVTGLFLMIFSKRQE
ncbi:MAG: hypothetical protein LBJ63_11710 [Prevotellaceae bacterium]|jgi:uncharacterized membrane protein HdeD (DUF308 family)|nr:hypothetical protein [Prevotellaceae bacterium]